MGLEEGLLAELCVNRGRMIPSHQNHPVPNNPLATLPNTRTSSVFVCLLALGPGDRVPGLGRPKRVLYHWAMSLSSSFPHGLCEKQLLLIHQIFIASLQCALLHSKLKRFRSEATPPSCILHLPSIIIYETCLEQCLWALLTSLYCGAAVPCFLLAGSTNTFVVFRWSVSHEMAQQE